MEGSLLTPTEQQFYSDWFSSCDQENSGKLTAHQVNKLFVSSQLNQEVLNKITELCGAYRVGHFGRSQFFLALKLIAMVQNGYQIPSSIEGLYSGIEVPLPKFATTRSNIVDQGQAKKDSKVLTTEDKPVQQVNEIRQMEFVNPAFTDHGSEFDPDKSQNRQPRQLPAPPSKSHVRNASSGGLGGLLQPRIPATTGSGSSENSPSSTPPLSDESKMLAPRSKTMDRMHSVPAPGHRKAVDRQASIPIRSDSGWANFTHPPSKSETSEANESVFPPKPDFGHDQGIMSERSDGVKDADEQNGQENVWLISDEQRLYYTEQFKTLQPDVTRIIQGNEAKQFFEKSKLPTTELSKIWQLSDVNKDGALCLEEFCTAMHLSVLRKHKYTLPDILPPCLVPKFNDVSSTDVQEGDTIISAAPTKKKAPPPPDVMNRSVTPSGLAEMSPKSKVKGGENWAKFSDSPFSGPSPSSEGPANFDFASISPDPESKIVQPIPLKLAPDGQTCIVSSDPSRPRKFSDPGSVSTPDDEEHLIPAKKRSATLPDSAAHTPTRIAPPPPVDRKGRDSASDMPMSPPQIPPRPRENAKNSVSSRNSSSLYSSSEFNSSNSSDDEDDDADGEDEHEDEKEEEPKLLQNFADFSRFENKSESPKYNKYNKSMSLDYRLMGRQQKSEEIIFPPVPPPRPAISEINTLQENKAQTSTQHKERHASGDLLSRKAEDYAKDRTRHQSAPLPIHVKNLKSFSRKGIQDKIRKIKEENTKLSRLNNELQQELKELTQDRIGLEVQFHKCKPFSINS
ncbi:ralBP1-associated Eps domain-containing protein 1-like isoform X3 [Antedon mediterranea]|uniref:ralBP1-associated Eps domain-containing protein 1-like isoform X3 n=1 Tax=Antedon mediterranea TaxID=105859 RepID=UPI003AF61ECA